MFTITSCGSERVWRSQRGAGGSSQVPTPIHPNPPSGVTTLLNLQTPHPRPSWYTSHDLARTVRHSFSTRHQVPEGPNPRGRGAPTRARERLCVCRNEELFCQSQGHARDTRSLSPAAPRCHSGLWAPLGPPPAGCRLCSAH